MKKFSLLSLAIASALVISPAVLVGQGTYNWSVDLNGMIGSGTITTTSGGDITAITGNFENTSSVNGVAEFSGNVIGLTNGTVSQGEAPTLSYSLTAPMTDATTDYYDDILYLNYNSPAYTNAGGYTGSGNSQLDVNGLVFNVQDPINGIYEIQIFQCTSVGGGYTCPSGSGLSAFVVNPNGTYSAAQNFGMTETNFEVPEGGTALLYLLLAGVGCFGAIFFKSRNGAGSPTLA